MISVSDENLFVSLWSHIETADAPFLRLSSPDRLLSYQSVRRRAAQYANALVNAGVTPGDRVAVQVMKSAENLCLYLGCLQAGGVYLPLNPAYTDQEVAYFLNDAEPTLLICDPTRTQGLTKPAKTCGVSDIWTLSAMGTGTASETAHACSDAFDPVPRPADDMVGILYTSGTTGRSKGAMISARNLLSNALALKACWRFTSDDVLLHALPIFHTHGLFVATHTIMAAGASMIFHPKFDVDNVLGALPKATTLMGVPTFYTRLLADPRLDKTSVSNIRLFVSGSAPLSAQTHKTFEERTGHAILERYGMTETNMITTNPYEGERRPGSVGFALPGVEVRVSNPDTGAALPRGETGVIEIRGPNVFSGYWRIPDKTETEFRTDGFFISGDLGYFDEDGYLALVGRSKDLIISGGFNVYPAEVETILDDINGVMESAVIGVPHPDLGECVAAVIVLKRDVELAADTVTSKASEKLARFKVPRAVVFVDELPRNAMGKVIKAELRDRYHGLFA